MRRTIAILLSAALAVSLAAPAGVLATDFDSFHDGAGSAGVEAGSEAGAADAGAGSDVEAGDGSTTSVYAAVVAADSPYLYYRLGEAAGASTARDSSTRMRDAVVRTKVTFGQPGAIAGDAAIHLEGDGALTIYGQAEFAANASFSIKVWARPDTTFTHSDGNALVIAGTESGNNNGRALFLYRSSHPKFERETANNDDIAEAAIDSSVKDYTYLVGTYDGSLLRLYVNGILAQTLPSTLPIPAGANVPFRDRRRGRRNVEHLPWRHR